jgi:hypothetical protein
MNAGLIIRLINLVRKSGHRVVFGDPDTGQAVVIMDLAEYERLIGLENSDEEKRQPEPYAPEVVGWQRSEPQIKSAPQFHPSPTFETMNEPTSQRMQPIAQPRFSSKQRQNLTVTEPPAKINREIEGQEANLRRLSSNQQSPLSTPNNSGYQTVNQRPGLDKEQPKPTAPINLDEEERFYLEPLE